MSAATRRTVEDGVDILRQMLNAKHEPPLNNLECLFAGLEVGKSKMRSFPALPARPFPSNKLMCQPIYP
jgi:hypothetical protein